MPTGRLGLSIHYTDALTLIPMNLPSITEVITSQAPVVCGLCSRVSWATANISVFRKIKK